MLLKGNCLDLLKTLPDNSIDSVVSDPPYELGFMGKGWDASGIAYSVELWREALRVLKPGGHLLAFGGTRTYHRLAVAIEDAGFEIRDSVHYSYGSGFPKSLSVHKATIKAVESKYGKNRCNCVDTRDGRSGGNNERRSTGATTGTARGEGSLPTNPIGSTTVSPATSAGSDRVRQLREEDNQTAKARQEGNAPVLLSGLCQCGPEEKGFGNTALRAGLEENARRDSGQGQELPSLRENPCGERGCASCSPPSSLSVFGNEQAGESGGLVRPVPPPNRVGDQSGTGADSGDGEPRRLVLDCESDGKRAVAWICSWCGLPDQQSLDDLIPLGTSLKPSHEPIVVARKPLVGTVAQTVLTYGTGALNIDGTRVGYESGEVDFDRIQRQQHSEGAVEGAFGAASLIGSEIPTYKPAGRWPANTIITHSPDCEQVGVAEENITVNADFSEHLQSDGWGTKRPITTTARTTSPVWNCVEGCPVLELDRQSGVSKSTGGRIGKKAMGSVTNVPAGQYEAGDPGYGDTGGASRFFTQTEYTEADWPVFLYYAKAGKRERNAGLEGLEKRIINEITPPGTKGSNSPRAGAGRTGATQNIHPTVKPVALMRHLIRLVTPPNGTVLDPFLGSGTTAVAAILEGKQWVGCELTEDYWPIIEARVAWAESQPRTLPL